MKAPRIDARPRPRFARAALACAFVAVPVTACGDSGADGAGGGSTSTGSTASGAGCKLAFIGDPSADVEMTLVARGADGLNHDLGEGDDVALILPPQGGRVIFVGARVNNVDPCAVDINGVLKDPTSGQVRLDERIVNLKEDETGMGAPIAADISTYSNIPLCPNQWASTSIFDNPFELTLTITDREGRTATRTATVTPRCAEPGNESECSCQCAQGYVLGQPCP